MELSETNIALILAILSLTVSILTAIANFVYTWYTRKAVQQSSYPSIRADLFIKTIQVIGARESDLTVHSTYFELQIENLSSNLSIADLSIKIIVSAPFRKWFLTWRSYHIVFEDYRPSLAPLDVHKENLDHKYNFRLEDLLESQVPAFLHKIEDYYKNHPRNGVIYVDKFPKPRAEVISGGSPQPHAYQVLKLHHIDILLMVAFLPGVYKARKQVVNRKYRFTPIQQTSTDDIKILSDWEIMPR